MKILVIALRAIGDMVLITPVVRLLKTSKPHLHLTVVVDAISYEVLLHNAYIDRLVVLDRNANKNLPSLKRIREELGFFSELRSERFDVAIDLFGGPRSALMVRLSGAPVRYGEDPPRYLLKWFYTHRATVDREGEHLVTQKLKIIRLLAESSHNHPPLELFLTEAEQEWADNYLNQFGLNPGEVLVGLFPGAGWEHKRWPSEKFAELADRLGKEGAIRVVLIGGVRDQAACEEVSAKMSLPPITLIQKSVRETMAVLDRLDLFVSNDTGPMHIAVALGCPTIVLFGPSNWKKYGPWAGKAKVVSENLSCSPCPQQVDTCWKVGRDRQECMKRIEVDRVFGEAMTFLNAISTTR